MKVLYTAIILFLSLQVSASAPTVPSSNLYFSIIDGAYFNLGWTAGNGAKRIIVCKAGSPVTFIPQNGVNYTGNTVFGMGDQPKAGEFIIYNSAFSSFFVTGLSPATQYFFAIFEYNGTGATTEYLSSSFLTANGFTSAMPTVQASSAGFTTITSNTVSLNWTKGDGLRCLIVVREGSPVNWDPANSQQYTGSTVFGNGAPVGAGNYSVYSSTGTNTSVSNLKPGTQYYFSFYEFNGQGQPQYKTPAYTTAVTTRSIPSTAASGVVISRSDGKQLNLDWTNGNGQRRIVVAKKGSDVTAVPVGGTSYTANAVFGSGSQLAAGEYVVFDDNFNAAAITGLEPATTYFFKIFEYDGTGSNTGYLTTSFGAVSGATAATPTVQTSGLSLNNAAASSLIVSFTPGDGRARLVVARQGAPVNVSPQNFTTYIANGDFGTGQDLGNGNFVVRSGNDDYASVQKLQANTTYHFAIFEYNGFNQPLFLTPATVFSATTLTALPVKLIQWEATTINDKVKLRWTTSSEINSSQFIVERSADGIIFSTIAIVQAAGNSGSELYYSKEDIKPLPGKSYYRLTMVDKDGHTEYSPVVTASLSANAKIYLLQNPVRQSLEIANTTSGNGQWQIVSATGQLINKGKLQTGNTKVNVNALAPGAYWFQLINSNNQLQTIPFIKQ